MLDLIDNPYQNASIAALNKHIEQYRKLLKQKKHTHKAIQDLLFQLYLINHLHESIKRKFIDNSYTEERLHYLTIVDFTGIYNELAALGYPPCQGLVAERLLSHTLQQEYTLPTIQEWRSITKSSFFTSPSKSTHNISKALKVVDKRVSLLSSPPTTKQAQQYLLALEHLKEQLIHELTQDVNATETMRFQKLLYGVNNEITKLLPNLALHISQKEQAISDMAHSNFYWELIKLPLEKQEKLALFLKSPNAINPGPPTRDEINQLLPVLKNFDFKKLGGANNANWKISNSETGENLVFQVGTPSDNQEIQQRLTFSEANEYLAINYYSTLPTSNSPYSITITQFCSGGDLKHERQVHFVESMHDEILQSSGARLSAVTDLCHKMLQQNVMHPDIKLTNFLIDKDNRVTVTDKKTLANVNADGTVNSQDIITTSYIEPPEFNAKPRAKQLNAESFMTYQLGLAFYDYLVLPKIPKDPYAKAWTEIRPLAFDAPIFQTEQGQKYQSLISKMIDDNPENRPSLKAISQELTMIHPELVHQDSITAVSHELDSDYSYRTRNTGRSHRYQLNGNNFKDLNIKYKHLKSDRLKTAIMDDIKQQIEHTETENSLSELIEKFKKSDEYKVLNTSQDITTHIFQYFGKKTSSVNAFNQMVEEHAIYLKQQNQIAPK